jgi:hypothetical protein
MDADRFDAVVKALGIGADRRRMFGGLVGGALALLAGGVAAHDTKARCRAIADAQKRKACLAKARRHARSHAPTTPPPTTTAAPSTTPRPGCSPEPREVTCAARGCGPKANNCGQAVLCGDCAAPEECIRGTCQCPSGQTPCAGVCCGAGERCCSGACASAGARTSPRGEGHPCVQTAECAECLVCQITGPGNATRCTRLRP